MIDRWIDRYSVWSNSYWHHDNVNGMCCFLSRVQHPYVSMYSESIESYNPDHWTKGHLLRDRCWWLTYSTHLCISEVHFIVVTHMLTVTPALWLFAGVSFSIARSFGTGTLMLLQQHHRASWHPGPGDAETSPLHHVVAPTPAHDTPCFWKGTISEPNRYDGMQVEPTA